MRWYADWIRYQIKKLGVEVIYNTDPKTDILKGFDAVILATGGGVKRPAIPGIDSKRVCTYEDILRCKSKNCEFYPGDRKDPVECGNTVLIWGDHFGSADTAEKLGVEGKKVYIVTENREFAAWMEPVHKDIMDKRFVCGNGEALTGKTFEKPVTIIPNSTVKEIGDDGTVVLMDNVFQTSELKVDNVVLASVDSDHSRYDELLGAGIKVVRIGDLKIPGNLRGAVTEGANIGLTLDEDLMLNANNALISKLPTDIEL
jgi:thioredoxin reductase